MKIKRKYISFLNMFMMLLFGWTATSCDEHFFEQEGDCEVTFAIRFVYDMNLKWADAFPSEVNSVNLYVFDSKGIFVKEYLGRGEALSRPDYQIMLDLKPDTYQFLAWCGLDNGMAEESFTVPTPVAGVTTIQEMTCSLNLAKSRADEGTEYSDRRLDFLYHGYLQETLIDTYDGAHYVYTMYLTKDTNHVRIMLQHTTGNLTTDDFIISLTAANGVMGWNNELIGNTPVVYSPWNMETDVLGVSNVGGTVMEYTGVIADMSTCRLMADKQNEIYLTVLKKDTGKLLFKVPVIQYSLTEREYYEEAYHHTITPQEFLDRQDEYLMTFFLDEDMNWLYVIIEIQQWRRVIRNYEISTES